MCQGRGCLCWNGNVCGPNKERFRARDLPAVGRTFKHCLHGVWELLAALSTACA
jgi:hypothetical protein